MNLPKAILLDLDNDMFIPDPAVHETVRGLWLGGLDVVASTCDRKEQGREKILENLYKYLPTSMPILLMTPPKDEWYKAEYLIKRMYWEEFIKDKLSIVLIMKTERDGSYWPNEISASEWIYKPHSMYEDQLFLARQKFYKDAQ